MPTEVRRRQYGRELVQLLVSQPHVPATSEELAGATGLTATQVSGSLGNVIRTNPGLGITRAGNGVYVFRPHTDNPATADKPAVATPTKSTSAPRRRHPRKATVVKLLSDNRYLVEIGGDLFVATHLDV